MKKTANLFIALAIFVALAIGFLIGISVEYPRLNKSELSGTIGKVNNYRNTKATEADIQLKTDLLADTLMLNSVKNYMTFFYVRSIQFGENIDLAVTTANANDAFKTKCGSEIAALESYGKFLETARKDLLLAVAVCKSAEKTDPAVLRGTIAQARNIVAQMNYRNSAVINFISELDSFIQEKGINNAPALNKVHDLLTYNEIGSSILLKDKVLLKYFEKKKLYCNDLKSSVETDLKENIQKDMEQLNVFDAEQLGAMDVQQLSIMYEDIEKLGMIVPMDAERLGMVKDSEELGYVVPDSEKLGMALSRDSEKLGITFDSEKLGAVIGGF